MASITNTIIAARRAEAFTRRGQAITYRAFSSATPNLKTGALGNTFSDTAISLAIIGYLSDQDVAGSQGRYKVGDAVFRVKVEDLPETPPSQKSLVVFDSLTYTIVGHRKSSDGYVYDIFGRVP